MKHLFLLVVCIICSNAEHYGSEWFTSMSFQPPQTVCESAPSHVLNNDATKPDSSTNDFGNHSFPMDEIQTAYTLITCTVNQRKVNKLSRDYNDPVIYFILDTLDPSSDTPHHLPFNSKITDGIIYSYYRLHHRNSQPRDVTCACKFLHDTSIYFIGDSFQTYYPPPYPPKLTANGISFYGNDTKKNRMIIYDMRDLEDVTCVVDGGYPPAQLLNNSCVNNTDKSMHKHNQYDTASGSMNVNQYGGELTAKEFRCVCLAEHPQTKCYDNGLMETVVILDLQDPPPPPRPPIFTVNGTSFNGTDPEKNRMIISDMRVLDNATCVVDEASPPSQILNASCGHNTDNAMHNHSRNNDVLMVEELRCVCVSKHSQSEDRMETVVILEVPGPAMYFLPPQTLCESVPSSSFNNGTAKADNSGTTGIFNDSFPMNETQTAYTRITCVLNTKLQIQNDTTEYTSNETSLYFYLDGSSDPVLPNSTETVNGNVYGYLWLDHNDVGLRNVICSFPNETSLLRLFDSEVEESFPTYYPPPYPPKLTVNGTSFYGNDTAKNRMIISDMRVLEDVTCVVEGGYPPAQLLYNSCGFYTHYVYITDTTMHEDSQYGVIVIGSTNATQYGKIAIGSTNATFHGSYIDENEATTLQNARIQAVEENLLMVEELRCVCVAEHPQTKCYDNGYMETTVILNLQDPPPHPPKLTVNGTSFYGNDPEKNRLIISDMRVLDNATCVVDAGYPPSQIVYASCVHNTDKAMHKHSRNNDVLTVEEFRCVCVSENSQTKGYDNGHAETVVILELPGPAMYFLPPRVFCESVPSSSFNNNETAKLNNSSTSDIVNDSFPMDEIQTAYTVITCVLNTKIQVQNYTKEINIHVQNDATEKTLEETTLYFYLDGSSDPVLPNSTQTINGNVYGYLWLDHNDVEFREVMCATSNDTSPLSLFDSRVEESFPTYYPPPYPPKLTLNGTSFYGNDTEKNRMIISDMRVLGDTMCVVEGGNPTAHILYNSCGYYTHFVYSNDIAIHNHSQYGDRASGYMNASQYGDRTSGYMNSSQHGDRASVSINASQHGDIDNNSMNASQYGETVGVSMNSSFHESYVDESEATLLQKPSAQVEERLLLVKEFRCVCVAEHPQTKCYDNGYMETIVVLELQEIDPPDLHTKDMPNPHDDQHKLPSQCKNEGTAHLYIVIIFLVVVIVAIIVLVASIVTVVVRQRRRKAANASDTRPVNLSDSLYNNSVFTPNRPYYQKDVTLEDEQ